MDVKAGFGALVVALSAAAQAPAGTSDWVQFVNETHGRLVADPSVGTADPQEKDYAWGDVDNDGDTDLVVVRKLIGSNSGGKRNVFFRNEGGVLVDRTIQFTTDADDGGQGFLDMTADRDVALADVNGDGWLDIVTAPSGAFTPGLPKTISHPRIYINNGEIGGIWQGFTYEERRIPTLPQAPNFAAVAAGDVTGDGHSDLYFVDYTNSLEDRLLVNDGTGFFSDETQLRLAPEFVASNLGMSAAIADNDADDILKVAHHGPLGGAIAYNDPSSRGTFPLVDVVYDGGAEFVSVGDLNNDALLDLVIVDEGTDAQLLNQGNNADGVAQFQSFALPNTNGFGSNTVIADLNQDGYLDILIADVDLDLPSCTNNRLKLLRNDGNPPVVKFAEDPANLPTTVPGGPLAGTHDVAAFDIDGDGWLDLVIGTCNGTTVWINQPRPCPADIDRNGAINVLDLIDLLLCFGQPVPPCGPADVNHDGAVDVLDLIDLLVAFGTPCP